MPPSNSNLLPSLCGNFLVVCPNKAFSLPSTMCQTSTLITKCPELKKKTGQQNPASQHKVFNILSKKGTARLFLLMTYRTPRHRQQLRFRCLRSKWQMPLTTQVHRSKALQSRTWPFYLLINLTPILIATKNLSKCKSQTLQKTANPKKDSFFKTATTTARMIYMAVDATRVCLRKETR